MGEMERKDDIDGVRKRKRVGRRERAEGQRERERDVKGAVRPGQFIYIQQHISNTEASQCALQKQEHPKESETIKNSFKEHSKNLKWNKTIIKRTSSKDDGKGMHAERMRGTDG